MMMMMMVAIKHRAICHRDDDDDVLPLIASSLARLHRRQIKSLHFSIIIKNFGRFAPIVQKCCIKGVAELLEFVKIPLSCYDVIFSVYLHASTQLSWFYLFIFGR